MDDEMEGVSAGERWAPKESRFWLRGVSGLLGDAALFSCANRRRAMDDTGMHGANQDNEHVRWKPNNKQRHVLVEQ